MQWGLERDNPRRRVYRLHEELKKACSPIVELTAALDAPKPSKLVQLPPVAASMAAAVETLAFAATLGVNCRAQVR